MFQALKNTAATLKTLKLLCDAAVRHAELEGLTEVGAEHFLLAAFDLPDGSARRCFQPFGVDAAALRMAIERSHAEALTDAGFAADALPPPAPIPRPATAWALPSSASGRTLLETLSRAGPTARPLCAAEVVLAALSARRGVVPRALRLLGVAAEGLAASASAERDAHLTTP